MNFEMRKLIIRIKQLLDGSSDFVTPRSIVQTNSTEHSDRQRLLTSCPKSARTTSIRDGP